MSFSSSKNERRNVILVTADDLHSDAMGWVTGKAGVTPNLDRVAHEAACFVNMHTSAPICQPSRQALMTGLVPHRNGGVGFNPIRGDVTTLPEILRREGYFTAAINKIRHMAPPEKFPWDWRRDRASQGHNTLSSPADSQRNPPNYFLDVCEAVDAAKSAGKPLFLNVNIADPHRPFYGTVGDIQRGGVEIDLKSQRPALPGFLDDLPDIHEELRQYQNSVERCDAAFGNILQAVSESELGDQVLIMFVADHGMPFPFSKATLYNAGTRTPFMILGQGIPNCKNQNMVSNTDIMPTLLEILNIPSQSDIDGRSLLPLLSDEAETRSEVFTHITSLSDDSVYPGRCYRTVDFSYIWNAWADGETEFHNESMRGLTFPAMVAAAPHDAEIAGRVKTFLYRSGDEFYDLRIDPDERANQVAEPKHRPAVATAREKLRLHMTATNDPFLKQYEDFLADVS